MLRLPNARGQRIVDASHRPRAAVEASPAADLYDDAADLHEYDNRRHDQARDRSGDVNALSGRPEQPRKNANEHRSRSRATGGIAFVSSAITGMAFTAPEPGRARYHTQRHSTRLPPITMASTA